MRIKSLDGTDRVMLILIFSIIYMLKYIKRFGKIYFTQNLSPKKHAHSLGYKDERTIYEGMYKNQQ